MRTLFSSLRHRSWLISLPGAVPKTAALADTPAGALGLGSVDASALTNLFTFLAYVIPIFGGIVADTRWGRFKTICVGECFLSDWKRSIG